jgi:multiple sugar transport system permease protein
MLASSLKTLVQATELPPQWIPDPVIWGNFLEATRRIPFWDNTLNTLYLCVMNIIGTVLSCSLVAYGFSRINWPGRDRLFALTIATMMVPAPVLMIPLYGIFRDLGWIGSFKPLWLPACLGSAYNIFLIRQFFMGIPRDLSESARIDGCSEWRIFWQVVLPLAKPALMVVGLFSFMYVWNDFLAPLIYLTNPEHYTLALGLQSFQNKLGGAELQLMMAAATMMVLPVMVLFFVAQRSFVEGISFTGIKS